MESESPDVHSSSEAYAARFHGAAGAYLLGVQESGITALVNRLGGNRLRVLDVGGGHGQAALPLVARGHEVTVLGSHAVCGRRIGACAGARFVVGDLADPPFANRSFDLVTCFRILPHMPNWRELLAGLCRTSERSILVDFPVARSINALAPLLFTLKRRVEGNTRAFATFSVSTVADALRDQGFAVSAIYREFALPMVLHRVLRAPRVSRSLEAAAHVAGVTHRFGSPVILLAERVTEPARPRDGRDEIPARPQNPTISSSLPLLAT